eukprot:630141-Pleurochrysis_carterae.AAC.2
MKTVRSTLRYFNFCKRKIWSYTGVPKSAAAPDAHLPTQKAWYRSLLAIQLYISWRMPFETARSAGVGW